MRVLMLGWEFPPHISGGLGTACLGISEGLVSQGVEVLFVVPRLFGDEPNNGVSLRSASEVRVPAHAHTRRTIKIQPRENAPSTLASSLELLTLDSPLRPYMTEIEYAHRLDQVRRQQASERAARSQSESSSDTTVLEAPASQKPEWMELSGGYGDNLVAEVERYADVVRELVKQEQFDVVHAHDWMTFPAAIVAAEESGKPLVLHVHACEYDRVGNRAHPGVCAVEQEGFDRADRLVCVSEYNADVLRKHYRIDDRKLEIVYNAVTRTEPRPARDFEKTIDGPIVLFLGRMTYQKGPDYFLEAAARVLEVMPNVRFVLSGTGDVWTKMVERAAQLGISEHTHFTGFLEGEDVERMFAMADLYVMPSVSEPFGISTLEALSKDVPTIISRQSGVAEVLQSALKVDFWDVEDLANKMLALLQYPALTSELSESGRVEVDQMTWELRGRSLLDIYEDLGS